MTNPERYGGTPVAAKIMGTLIALALLVVGGLWTFWCHGAATTLGPIVAGLGVALGYVVLIQKRG